MVEKNKKHSLFDCEDCLLFADEEYCRAFEDYLNPITDEEGYCSAKIVDKDRYVKLAKETDMPFSIHTTKDCENCLLLLDGECKVYENQELPLYNDEGKCLGKTTTIEGLEKIINDTSWDYFRKKLKKGLIKTQNRISMFPL